MRVRLLEARLRLSELEWNADLSLEALCGEVAAVVRSTWHDPGTRWCRIALDGLEIRSPAGGDPIRKDSAEIHAGGAVAGLIETGPLGEDSDGSEEPSTEEIRTLLSAAANHLGRILSRRRDEEALRRSHASFKKAGDIARLGYWDWDIRTNDLVWSDGTFRIYGMDPVTDRPKYDVVVGTLGPECRDRFLDALGKALESDVPFDGEYRLIGLDGRERFTHTTGEVVRDAEGRPVSMFGVVRDVTERKRGEGALHEQERLLSLTQEIAHVGSWTVDLESGLGQMSEEGYRIFGVAPGTTLAYESFLRLLHPDDVPSMEAWIARGKAGGHPPELEFRIVRPDGMIRTLVGRGDIFPCALGGSPRMVGSVQDITERRHAEEALRESERRYHELFEHAGDYILVIEAQGERPPTIVDVNHAAVVKHGYSREEMIGQPISFLDPAPPEVLVERARMADSGIPFEVTHQRHNGTTFVAEAVVRPVVLGGKRLYISIERDITERREAEDAIRANEEKFQRTFRSAPAMMALTRAQNGTVLDVNDRFCEVFGFGREEILGKSLMELGILTSDQRTHMIQELRTWGHVRALEQRVRARDGHPVVISLSVESIRIQGEEVLLSASEDVSQRKQTEERLLTLQKLESLGTLAGGIAHDFNNLLTGILGGISLLREGVDESSEAMAILKEAEAASHTARGLARQLLTFAEGGKPLTRSEDLRPIVHEAATFAARGSNVRCAFGGQEEPVFAEVDRDQLAQVVQNLVINAVQAMPMGGTVQLDLDVVDEAADAARGVAAGRYARLTVTDEGVGIRDEVRQRIFDPYFSTKSRGRGLGLAVCHSIVVRHGGRIAVESTAKQGATFVVHLPTSAVPPKVVSAAPARGTALVGTRVLVMDDEPAVATVLKRMLARLGAEAEVAGDGAAALEAYRQAGEAGRPYALVIADLTVPGGMGGKEMAQRIKAVDPGARIIVSSGYSNDPVMADYQEHGFIGVLSKPYHLAEVSALLGRTLAS